MSTHVRPSILTLAGRLSYCSPHNNDDMNMNSEPFYSGASTGNKIMITL